MERGEEKLEREERDTLDQSTSTGIRASKTPICDHEISEQVRDDRAPPETGGELPLDAYVEVTAPRRFTSR